MNNTDFSNKQAQCDLSNRDETIDAYLAGELSETGAKDLEEHLFTCHTCFQELQFREEVVSLIREEGETLFADYLEKQAITDRGWLAMLSEKLRSLRWEWQPRWVYATASAGALAVLFFFVFNLIKPSDDKIVLANFEVSPYLEEMIVDISRSYSITILSPKIGENVKRNILFYWEIDIEGPIYLKILNNRGDELFSYEPEKNQFRFNEKLPPGLYYWKLQSEDDLLFVGKFFVKKPKE